jgi:hypothetical protein
MVVSYRPVALFPGWDKAPEFFKTIILEHSAQRILEIGSGAHPTLPPQFVEEQRLSYVTSDRSEKELEKADTTFERLVVDMSSKNIDDGLLENFDLILSRMVGEHVSDGEQYYSNIYKMLRPGGISAHCFASLWTLPFAVNRLLPEPATDLLLRMFAPRDRYKYGKFKAYYSWSRGPTKKMIRRFEDIGYEVVCYTGYFGHGYYGIKMPWLQPIEDIKSKFLLRNPIPQLCSYATLILRKPS